MSARMTIFTATLVQDSALSVAGVDRESTSDQPFVIVDGCPVLSGRGLKGAAVAMARRFFDPLPRRISERPQQQTGLLRSAWEFSNARPERVDSRQLRAGVGILQKTGARAEGVIFDREVVCAGTRWDLVVRVSWRQAGDDGEEIEGILGYVLSRHWREGRCWLGGGVARGLGWCHLEDLRAYRLDNPAYDAWVDSGRTALPAPEPEIPIASPTRSWCFRTLDIMFRAGEYCPDPDAGAWGVDMLAVGPHDTERNIQHTRGGSWARPAWAVGTPTPNPFITDRAILMENATPVLPGGSVRGPLRHAFSRDARRHGTAVEDPHIREGDVGNDDPAGKVFGTVAQSSRVLVRDAHAGAGWAAACLHMHAEDEFSAGSYGSAKRDAVRLLRAEFPVQLVVEGPDTATVSSLTSQLDRVIALGALGHLPVGGHKTRGAGWGQWKVGEWSSHDVFAERAPVFVHSPTTTSAAGEESRRTVSPKPERFAYGKWRGDAACKVNLVIACGWLELPTTLSLGEAATHARAALLHDRPLWWCEPAIDFAVVQAPQTFGCDWPLATVSQLRVEEVAFFAPGAVWRVARTSRGWRTVHIREVAEPTKETKPVFVLRTPARLHRNTTRFAAHVSESSDLSELIVREWHTGNQIIGYTLAERGQ